MGMARRRTRIADYRRDAMCGLARWRVDKCAPRRRVTTKPTGVREAASRREGCRGG